MKFAAQNTLEFQNMSIETDLSIVITDNEQIQALNLQYRGIDSSTDVLSFPADFVDPDNKKTYLGDVIISYPKCLEQAQSANHSTNDELILLVVHGVLHLLGFDHIQNDDKKRMWSLQAVILKQLDYLHIDFPR
ncbi:MAG: rRNA maturation RNase YbeY [Anaerolineales bacterium]|nr:rRNA maturation RNase YbeY [Anaerolineales bacterium]